MKKVKLEIKVIEKETGKTYEGQVEIPTGLKLNEVELKTDTGEKLNLRVCCLEDEKSFEAEIDVSGRTLCYEIPDLYERFIRVPGPGYPVSDFKTGKFAKSPYQLWARRI